MSFWQQRVRPLWTFWVWAFFAIVVVVSWLVWFFTPKTPLNWLVMDKTVVTDEVPEHRSLHWVLNHHRYTDTAGNTFSPEKDYLGFFPLKQPTFVTHDLKAFPDDAIIQLGQSLDALYYTDTYGIYSNEWYGTGSMMEHSGLVYGGLIMEDATLINEVYKHPEKLLLLEFNLLASPTEGGPRRSVEKTVGMEFSGWTGRIFPELDSSLSNADLPRWVVRMYKQQHEGRYPFKGKGLVMVHEDGRLDILRLEEDLGGEYPLIRTGDALQQEFSLPAQQTYVFWFDIMRAKDSTKTLATYHLQPTKTGDSILKHNGIPAQFPAIMQLGNRPNAWYFCGDWADNTLPYLTTYFAGSQYLSFLYYPWLDTTDRRGFFWRYYHPLMRGVLSRYDQSRANKVTRGATTS